MKEPMEASLRGRSIRRATLEDAHCLAALSIQVWLDTYAKAGIGDSVARYVLATFSPQKFIQLAADETAILLVAEETENLTGYALVRLDSPCPFQSGPDVELCTLYVQEPFTGARVGTELLAQALSVVSALTQSGRLWLSVKSDNLRARAFYERRGFAMRGTVDFVLAQTSYENCVYVSEHHDTATSA
jgi:diamine N-acetyltransferase